MMTNEAVLEAREALAARLERLARRIRQGTDCDYQTEQRMDAAYAEVVKLNYTLQQQNLLG